MFESITVTARNSFEYSKPLDIGSLVESMLFYGQSTLVANYAMLDQLYQYFGGEYLYRLLSEEFLNIVYLESTVGIRTALLDNCSLREFRSSLRCLKAA